MLGALAVLWLAVVAGLVVGRLAAGLRFQRRVRRRGRPAPPEVLLVAADVARQLGGRALPLLVTDAVRAPALQGIFESRLLFPEGLLEELSESELRFVIGHEMAHVRRRDLLAVAVIHAAAIVHWFNPLVWVLARTARSDCEFACDQWVVRRLPPDEPRHYGATLLRIASLVRIGAPPPFALGMAESKPQLTRRIHMILSHRSAQLAPTLAACAAFALLAAFSFTTRATAAESSPYTVGPDHFETMFPSGTVAAVGGRTITVDEVRREIAPAIVRLERDSRSQRAFDVKLEQLRNETITKLVNRAMLISEFSADGKRHIAATFVDRAIADDLKNKYDGDQTRFDADLKARGLTPEGYRTLVEENIIYDYMIHQQRLVAKD